jgi:peptide/nickel transport system substrate-binding protein
MQSYGATFVQDVVGAKAFAAGRAGRIAGVVARGNLLKIRLTAPSGDLVTRLALPSFCAVPADSPIDPRGISTLPSAGPYYVASYTPGVQLVLRRNPNYRGSRPHRLSRIVYTFGIGQEQSARQVVTGTADFAADGFPADVARRLAARYGERRPGRPWYTASPSLAVRYVAMNTSRGIFADARIRRAASAALDRVALSRELAKTFTAGSLGGGFPTEHYLPPGLPGAPALSTPAGPDLRSVARYVTRRPAQALMLTCNHSPCPQVARIVRQSLARIGIDVTVQYLPTALVFARAAAPGSRFDLMTLGWAPDFPDPASAISWLFDPTENFPHFHDARYAKAFAAASRLPAPARFRALAALAHRLETDAVPAIPYELDVVRAFFSARTGCQIYQPVYGVDLAALCLRS